jgi:hypothetical protein
MLIFDGLDNFPSFINGNEKITIDPQNSKKLTKQIKQIDANLVQETKDKLDRLNENVKEHFADSNDKALANVQNLQWLK